MTKKKLSKKNSDKKLNKRIGELTIVGAAIIFLLIVAFLLTITDRAENRDIERISGTNKIREALQFYYLDKNYYPIQTEWCSVELNCDNLSAELRPYLNEMPRDPFYPQEKNGKKYSYQYRTTADGLEYKIFTNSEEGKSYELHSKGGFLIPSPQQ
jgi:type II secretory pathway pseudopilin PulG